MARQLAECQTVTALPRGRGRGPGGRPTGLPLPEGRCPVSGCLEEIDRTRLMCRRDWYLVRKPLRDQVWRTWCSGQTATSCEHRQTVLKAIVACQLARMPSWRRLVVRLCLLPCPRPLQHVYPVITGLIRQR
jgi:hypothetical protein